MCRPVGLIAAACTRTSTSSGLMWGEVRIHEPQDVRRAEPLLNDRLHLSVRSFLGVVRGAGPGRPARAGRPGPEMVRVQAGESWEFRSPAAERSAATAAGLKPLTVR